MIAAGWVQFRVPVEGIAFACELHLGGAGVPDKFRTSCRSPISVSLWPAFDQLTGACRLANQLLAVALFDWETLAALSGGRDVLSALVSSAAARLEEMGTGGVAGADAGGGA